jgi:hypothetical protein
MEKCNVIPATSDFNKKEYNDRDKKAEESGILLLYALVI